MVTAIDSEARTITIADLVSKKPMTIRVAADTHLKEMPNFRGLFKNGKPSDHPVASAQKLDVGKLIEMLPLTKFESLKVGGAVMVSSTRGSESDAVTATRIISNADFLIETAQAAAAQQGVSTVDVISGLHGGAMGGAGGLSLPAIVP